MEREEVIRMVREAGFTRLTDGLRDNGDSSEYWDCWPEQLERFASLVAAAERERAAKVCENECLETTGYPEDAGYNMAIKHAAAAIRVLT